jgi:hypothetical protein
MEPKVFPRHERFSSLLVTGAGFKAHMRRGQGFEPCGLRFCSLGCHILHGAGICVFSLLARFAGQCLFFLFILHRFLFFPLFCTGFDLNLPLDEYGAVDLNFLQGNIHGKHIFSLYLDHDVE